MSRPRSLLIGMLIVAVELAFALPADAKTQRSAKAKADFKRQHPCPVTGSAKGKCHGYVIDHIIPLCAGGADHPSNMQWQTVADAKAKDKLERRQCRR